MAKAKGSVGVVYINPNDFTQVMFADPVAVQQGQVTPPVGWTIGNGDGTPYRGDPRKGAFLPDNFFQPAFSGGYPAYNNGPQQLGMIPGKNF